MCVRTTTFRRGHTRRANVSPPIHSECLTAGNKEFLKNQQHCTSVLIFSYSFGRGAQAGAENKGRRMLSIVGRKGMIKYGLAFRWRLFDGGEVIAPMCVCVCVCVCCQQTDMAMWHARTRVTNSGLLGAISSDTDFWGLVFIFASFTFHSAGWPTSEKPTSNHLHLGLVVSRRGDKLSGCTRIWSKVIQWYSNNDDTFVQFTFCCLNCL